MSRQSMNTGSRFLHFGEHHWSIHSSSLWDGTRLFNHLSLPFKRAVRRELEQFSTACPQCSEGSFLQEQDLRPFCKLHLQPLGLAPTFRPPNIGQRLSSANGHQHCLKTQAWRDQEGCLPKQHPHYSSTTFFKNFVALDHIVSTWRLFYSWHVY